MVNTTIIASITVALVGIALLSRHGNQHSSSLSKIKAVPVSSCVPLMDMTEEDCDMTSTWERSGLTNEQCVLEKSSTVPAKVSVVACAFCAPRDLGLIMYEYGTYRKLGYLILGSL